MRKEEALKNFRQHFEKLSYSRSYAETFNDFLDFALWMLNPMKDAAAFEEVKHIDNKYNETEAQHMSEMFQAWASASDNDGAGFYDALGDLFMELLSYGKNGQYFTPDPICDMMAAITFTDKLQEGKTICDPTCGSGRMLLSAAKIQRKMKFFGADVDITCCKMTALNMIVNSMPGEVAWMNTLSMEHWKSWHIYLVRDSNDHVIPCYYTTRAGNTFFISALEKAQQEMKPLPDHRYKGPEIVEGHQFILF